MFSSHDKWRAWVVAALLFLFMVINYADKAVIGSVAVSVMHDMSLTPGQFGLIGSSFFLLYSVSGIVFGFVADRVKTRWVLVFLAMGHRAISLIGLCLVNPEKSSTKLSRLIQTSGSRRSADAGVSKRISHDGGLIKQDKE